jgi:tryptophan-rich sensory protein
MKQRDAALLLAGGAVLAAALFGAQDAPRPDHPRTLVWYGRLRKPGFTPGGAAIGAAWMGLYGLLAWSGYRLMVAPPSRDRTLALACWSGTTAGIGLWPRLFFGLRSLGGSLAGVIVLAASTVATVLAGWRVDRAAAAAAAPLTGWVFYAAVLNEELWRRN